MNKISRITLYSLIVHVVAVSQLPSIISRELPCLQQIISKKFIITTKKIIILIKNNIFRPPKNTSYTIVKINDRKK